MRFLKPEYHYRVEKVRLEVDHNRSTKKFEYCSWYVYTANEEASVWNVGVWDVYPISTLTNNGWELVSINLVSPIESMDNTKGEEAYYATFKRLK